MDVKKNYSKRVEKKPRMKRYKIKSISLATSTFNKPEKYRDLKISPGREFTVELTPDELKQMQIVESHGKFVKRTDIKITEKE